MPALDVFAVPLVFLTGAFLLALGAATFVTPQRAAAFLGGFARSARAHYLELLVRMLVGAAFVVGAVETKFATLLHGFGWVVLATTCALLVLPWRWHSRFAAWSVPLAVRRLPLLGGISMVAGGFVMYASFAR